MKIERSRYICALAIGVAGVVGSCASDEPATGSTLDPNVSQPAGTPGGSGTPGAGAGGAASGGSASGAGGGTVGGSTPGAAGGTAAGGAIGQIMIEDKPCEKKVRTAGKTIPDFMIVLDRSGSMRPGFQAGLNCKNPDLVSLIVCASLGIDCNDPSMTNTLQCGGTQEATDRWAPAVSAIKSLTSMFEAKVNFGLTTFPGNGRGRDEDCAAGMQRVPVGPNSAGAIATALDMTQPGGGTPTGPTLEAVRAQIAAKQTSPDEVLPPQYVLLVTDGQPTCPNNNQQAHQATIAAIDALAKAGVKTYVIGYDASVNAQLARQLTEYAQHGGTGNFYAVQDGPSLVAKFTEITGVVAECSYQLDKKPDDPRLVLVELDGKPLKPNDENGWVINERNVTIQGSACATLRDGSRQHTLAVTVECSPPVLE